MKNVFRLGVRAAAILDLGVTAEPNPVECVSQWILFKYTMINTCGKFHAFFPIFHTINTRRLTTNISFTTTKNNVKSHYKERVIDPKPPRGPMGTFVT